MGFQSAPVLEGTPRQRPVPASGRQLNRTPAVKSLSALPPRMSGVSARARHAANAGVAANTTVDRNASMKTAFPGDTTKNATKIPVIASRGTAFVTGTIGMEKRGLEMPPMAKIPVEQIKLAGGAGLTGTTTAGGVDSQTARTVQRTAGSWTRMPTSTPRQQLQQSPKVTPVIGHINSSGGLGRPVYASKMNETSHEDLSFMGAAAKAAPPPDGLKNTPIAQRWKCQRKIGSGSFGDTYLAINIENGSKVAVKVEPVKARHPQLLHEAKILRQIQGQAGFPQLYHFGIHLGQYNVIVMELLGPTLEEVFARWGRRQLQLPTIALLGVQMLDRLEALHKQGYIHRDVKPDNFLIGVGTNANQVYCIDFGLAKRYRDARTNAHIPYNDRRSLTGTARYASINAHIGIEPTRRDDLTSTGYALLYFARGGHLPWQGLQAKTKSEKYQKIMEKKMHTSFEQLTEGLPDAFTKFLRHCKDLAFEQEPDYNRLRGLLSSIISDTKTLPPPSGPWTTTGDTSHHRLVQKGGGNQMLSMFEHGLHTHHENEGRGFPDPVVPQHNNNNLHNSPSRLRLHGSGGGFDPRTGVLPYFNDDEINSMRKRASKKGRGIFCLTCARKSNSSD